MRLRNQSSGDSAVTASAAPPQASSVAQFKSVVAEKQRMIDSVGTELAACPEIADPIHCPNEAKIGVLSIKDLGKSWASLGDPPAAIQPTVQGITDAGEMAEQVDLSPCEDDPSSGECTSSVFAFKDAWSTFSDKVAGLSAFS